MVKIITKKLENGVFMAQCSERYGMVVYDECEDEAIKRLNHKLKMKTLKEELNLTKKEIAEFFGLSYNSFANSSARNRYENALFNFFEYLKNYKQE